MAKKASDVPTKWDEKSNDETIFPWGEKRQQHWKASFPKRVKYNIYNFLPTK